MRQEIFTKGLAYAVLQEKGWSQKDLAEALGKSTAEVSKWLSGSHNLTLRSIAKMEAALAADIILTPKKAALKFKQVEYIILKAYASTNKLISADIQYTEISGSTPVSGKQDVKTTKAA